LLYEDLKTAVKKLGFSTIESFANYVGVTSTDVLEWESKDEVPYTIALVVHLLQGNQEIPNENNTLDILVEECLPLATLLEESSSFPSKLEEMFMLQKKLNDDTNGKNWELGINKYEKEINWLRCIHMEVAELIDSTPWKHWKNISDAPDMSNLHIELVDVWHFLMSYILQETNIPKAVSMVNTHCIYEAIPLEDIEIKLVVKEAEKLSYIAFAIETGNMPQFSGVERFIGQFFRCCKLSGLSFSWLQKLYIGKNALNKFRQDNGYKEGTYKKVWNGQEDNELLVTLLEQLEDATFEKVYSHLQQNYPQ
jgi:dimeric dUTPase (all-alpha-NTP-PPase superfamily)